MSKQLYAINDSADVRVAELFLSDTLDVMEFDKLNEAMLQAVDSASSAPWVLDLSATTYMGSAVLGLLVNIRQRIKQARGTLVLCGLTPRLEQIFRACCMERLFTIVKTRNEAMERIR